MRRNQISNFARPRLSEPVSGRDHKQGSDRASLTLLEYGDYECPYCGSAHPMVQRLQQAFGSDLRFVFRNFPLTDIHPNAMMAAEAVEAASLQGKFWQMHDLMFANQGALDRGALDKYAKDVGLNVATFKKALDGKQYVAAVDADVKLGGDAAVNGTPSLFLNGARVENPSSFEAVSALIEAALKK